MEMVLNEIEARVLGVLIEKQMATPDYYPLTLNALVNACNQTTNRDPVMNLDKSIVEEALTQLRNHRMVWQVKAQGSRALKYEHNMRDVADFSDREMGLVCMLLLRGPQTAGELRSRTARLAEFHGLAAVEHTLQKLARHEAGPFVVRLDRLPGHKENRYAQLFSEVVQPDDPSEQTPPVIAATPRKNRPDDRVQWLEKKVEDMQLELDDLKTQFNEFRRQFED